MGESICSPLRLQFDRRLRLEFHGATITSDAGRLASREMDDALGLAEMATAHLEESRTRRNVQHQLAALGPPQADLTRLEKGVRLQAINWRHPVWDSSELIWGIPA